MCTKRLLFALVAALLLAALCACEQNNDVKAYLYTSDGDSNSITNDGHDTASTNTLPINETLQPSSSTPGAINDVDSSFGSDEPSSATSALEVYKAVLLSQVEFIDAYDNNKMAISNLNQMFSPEVVVTVTHFAVIDLDHDGTPEVILSIDVNGHSSGVEILSYQDGDVYGYSFSDRQFGGLRTDGTFEVSESAGTGGICTITFDKNSYSIDKNLYHILDTDTAGNDIMIFSINQRSVTEDEYDAAYSTRDLQPRVTRYEFTEANVDFVLSQI